MSKKNLILSKVVTLLDKLSNRVSKIAQQANENTNDILAVRHAGSVAFESVTNEVIKVKTENDKREAAQTLRDQSNVQSLKNLRDSVQKGFDQIKNDVESLLKLNQRLNERVSQVESQNLILVGVAKLTQVPSKDELPAGHVWFNKKLAGVYESLEEQEVRIKNLEKIQGLYEALRKAQNEFAIANGAFLAGPKA